MIAITTLTAGETVLFAGIVSFYGLKDLEEACVTVQGDVRIGTSKESEHGGTRISFANCHNKVRAVSTRGYHSAIF